MKPRFKILIMYKEQEFKKQKVAQFLRVAKKLLIDDKDYVKSTIEVRLEGYMYERTIAEKEITYHLERPSFMDWLLRRRTSKTIKVNISEALNNPPETPNTTRLFDLKKLD